MGIPQIILLVLYVLNLGVALSDHGKVELKRESFFTTLFATAIQMWLLWLGGFFD